MGRSLVAASVLDLKFAGVWGRAGCELQIQKAH
jgi:hypothetical protein